MQEYYIPQPLKDIFLNRQTSSEYLQGTPESVIKENPHANIIDYVELNNGIYVHYKGIPYPKKGYPFPEAVAQINVIKRVLIDTCALLLSKELALGFITFILFPKRIKRIEKILEILATTCYPTISKYMVKPELMTQFSSEFQGIVFGFLANMGISVKTSKKIAYIFGAIFEYDNAYRYRLEDLFTETTKEKLSSSPIKESRRILKMYLQREKHGRNYKYKTKRYVSDKFKSVYFILVLLLLIPKMKKAFIKAIDRSEFNRLQLDDIDKYWCKNRHDYDFFGQSLEERMKDFEGGQTYELKI